MDVDPRRPFGEDEDEEVQHRPPARTPAPPKKPLDVFLAEFERRLAEHPDQPATDAHLALEARAEGARRQPPGPPRAAAPPPVEVEPEPEVKAEPKVAPEPQPGPGTEPPAPPEAKPAPETAQGQGRRRPRRRGHQRRRH